MPDDLEFFLSLESQIWDALKAGDVEADAQLLADDFLGVYHSGFSAKSGHVAQLRGGPSVAEYRIEAARLVHVSPSLAILSYRAVWRHTKEEHNRVYYITSVWKRREQGWLNIFSQDTKAQAPA